MGNQNLGFSIYNVCLADPISFFFNIWKSRNEFIFNSNPIFCHSIVRVVFLDFNFIPTSNISEGAFNLNYGAPSPSQSWLKPPRGIKKGTLEESDTLLEIAMVHTYRLHQYSLLRTRLQRWSFWLSDLRFTSYTQTNTCTSIYILKPTPGRECWIVKSDCQKAMVMVSRDHELN